MQYRNLGNTDLSVSALSLGTVALGMRYGITPDKNKATDDQSGMTPPSDKEAIQLVHRAIDGGINFIDTARAYGRSEEVLGSALHDRRDKVVLTTKLGCHDAEGNILRGQALRQHMQDSVATSLKLLRTDWVDLLMLHSASVEILQNGEAIDMLKEFQTQGKARYIGASTYGIEAPRIAISQGINALQVAYNILDQRMADIFSLAETKGVGIVVRSVFLKGVLTPRADDLPDHLASLKQKSEAVKKFAEQLTPPMNRVEAALRFVLSQQNITSALVGVHTQAELNTSLRVAAQKPLSEDVMTQFEQLGWDDPIMLNPSTWGLP
jgi:1-deoxyxylulose-5-phosphate synthase